ncbi:ras GTPase-activating protein-binding protein 2-like [Sycon ciliatum]|uniref:ras GTPase-activating protein-binding protein 2-like n=1 Tax=Sycon ciliatum TaxID=27933 RepID=UPI0020ADA67D|eukprot:scpid47179/ scgid24337/ Ras GTPase-activating protein-binding protein 2; GAP SH3 domain-binding protein 2 &gt; Ras GTPase-activating protein-binding protein 2; GAP SH3 domain-binding protein 2
MDPRSIGHEFVRQYYELLHNDPAQLHRFYLDSSTYIHAGENQNDHPAVGQQAIYETIKQLNFSDCRTRIRQVDAQDSLQKSFIVQVVGELSNAGQPMRPFVQTFVLAESAENKFFVSNDMFRYQDHIVAPEASEPVISVPAVVPAASVEQPITNGQVADYFSKPTESHAHLNGDVTVIDAPEPVEAVAPVEEPVVHQPEPTPPPVHTEPEPEPIVEPEPSQEVKQEPKAFSWASVASSSSSSSASQPASKKVQPAGIVRAPVEIKPVAAAPSTQQQQQQPQQQQTNQRPQRRTNGSANNQSSNQSSSVPTARNGAAARSNAAVPDSQQVFVGGLNSSMTEDEIKGAFREFGTAIDIRMTQKQFCFVAFESSQIVDSILAHAKESGFQLRGHRLNVEEKKEKASGGRVPNNRQNTGGRGGRVGTGSNNSFSRGGATANRSGRDSSAVNRR